MSSGTRAPCKPSMAAQPHTTASMPRTSRSSCVGAGSRRPTSSPRRCGRPVISSGAASTLGANAPSD